jgi:hypothetical protein
VIIEKFNPAFDDLIELFDIVFDFTGVFDSPLEKGNCMKDTALVDILSENIPLDFSWDENQLGK